MKLLRVVGRDLLSHVRSLVVIEYAPGEWTVYEVERYFGASDKSLLGLVYRYHSDAHQVNEGERVIRVLTEEEARAAFNGPGGFFFLPRIYREGAAVPPLTPGDLL